VTEVTSGHLLGGQLSYAQPAHGYRTGLEPVLLAASIPASAAQTVLELGTGAGAALLCLAHRLPQLRAVGVERDPAMADLARDNIARNGFSDRLSILTADISALPMEQTFDHACANPPWHDPLSTRSPNPAKSAAKQAAPNELAAWAAALAARVTRRGTVTLILPAALLADGINALTAARCGAVTIHPFWPTPGRPARLIILQATRNAAGPSRLLAGLVLHHISGGFTPQADALLRDGASIRLGMPQMP